MVLQSEKKKQFAKKKKCTVSGNPSILPNEWEKIGRTKYVE